MIKEWPYIDMHKFISSLLTYMQCCDFSADDRTVILPCKDLENEPMVVLGGQTLFIIVLFVDTHWDKQYYFVSTLLFTYFNMS